MEKRFVVIEYKKNGADQFENILSQRTTLEQAREVLRDSWNNLGARDKKNTRLVLANLCYDSEEEALILVDDGDDRTEEYIDQYNPLAEVDEEGMWITEVQYQAEIENLNGGWT